MPIGYYNFGNIQQGNEFAANQLAGLGQQIGQAITTHAQTQAASAALPVIQNQYTQGLQKIASGDTSGFGEVTQAASLAGQIPIIAHYGNAMMNGAVQASEMARTKSLNDARMSAVNARVAGAKDVANLNYARAYDTKQMGIDAAVQLQQTKAADQLKNIEERHKDRLDEISKLTGAQRDNALAREQSNFDHQKQLWQFKMQNPVNKPMNGAELMNADKNGLIIQNALKQKLDTAKDADSYNDAATTLSQFAQHASQIGISNPGIPYSYEGKKKIADLQKAVQSASKPFFGYGDVDQTKLSSAQKAYEDALNDPSNYALTDNQKSQLEKLRGAIKKGAPLDQAQKVSGLPANLLQVPQSTSSSSQSSTSGISGQLPAASSFPASSDSEGENNDAMNLINGDESDDNE